jgi:hypothetical protein
MLIYDSTCFGQQYAHHQEYNSEFRFGIQTWKAKSGTQYCTADDGHIGARNMLS